MAHSLSEIPDPLDVVETSDEGKKKSKFKVFKGFFGKKKKKDADGTPTVRTIQPSLSSGNLSISLKPIPAEELLALRYKSNMGTKALSHDSIFMLEPERERSASRRNSPPEHHRGNTLQMLPIQHHQLSITPPLIRHGSIYKDLDLISMDDDILMDPQMKSTSPKSLKAKKVKPQQGESRFPLSSEEEKTATMPKQIQLKKLKRDTAGPSSQEQSKKSESSERKTMDKALGTDTVGRQGRSTSASHGRKRERKLTLTGLSECKPRERSHKKSSRGHGLGDRAESPFAENTGKDSPDQCFASEKQFREQPTTPWADIAAGEAKGPFIESIAEDIEEPMDSIRSPYAGDIPSMSEEAQGFMDPSYAQSEWEAIYGLDSRSAVFKMESAQSTPTIFQETPSGNVSQDLPAGAADTASAREKRGISAERLPPQIPKSKSFTQAWWKPGHSQQSSDAESTSEEERESEELEKSEDGSGSSSDTDSSLEVGAVSQVAGHSSPPLGKPEDGQEVILKSQRFWGEGSTYGEQLVPRYPSQDWGGKEVSTGSISSLEKDRQAKDWSRDEEDWSSQHHSSALGMRKDKLQVSVAEKAPEGQKVAAEQLLISQPVMMHPVSSGSLRGPTEGSDPVEPASSWDPYHQWESMHAGAQSMAEARDITLPPLPPRTHQRHLRRLRAEQQAPSGAQSPVAGDLPEPKPPRGPMKPEVSRGPKPATVEESLSMPTEPSDYPSQPWARPVVEPQVPVGAENVAPEEKMFMGLPPLRRTLQSWPPASSFPESTVAKGPFSREQLPSKSGPKYPAQPLGNPRVKQISESTTIKEGTLRELLPPESRPQPLMRPEVQPQIMPPGPRGPVQSRPVPTSEPQVSVVTGPKGAAFEEDVSQESVPYRPPSEEVVADPMSASATWGGSVEPVDPQDPFQPWGSPEFEQYVAGGSEGPAFEGAMLMEPPTPKQPLAVGSANVQHVSSDLESAAVEEGHSGKPLPPRYPTELLMDSSVQETAKLESSAAEGAIPKKLLPPMRPSKSYVKFMAEQIFSNPESPAVGGIMYVNPLPPKPSPKAPLQPKVEPSEGAGLEEGVSMKPKPTVGPLQSLEKPEEHQEDFLVAEKWRIFEEQLASRRSFQANGAQPQSVSAGPPVEQSSSEKQLPPRSHVQSIGDPEEQPQVPSRPTNATTERDVAESDAGSSFLPRAPDSSNKPKKPIQGSEDLTKHTPSKMVKFANVQPPKKIIPSSLSFQREILNKEDTKDNKLASSPTTEDKVENIFGVKLRRVPFSQKYRDEKKQGSCPDLQTIHLDPALAAIVKEQPVRRAISQWNLSATENLAKTFGFERKQQMGLRAEGVTKQQPTYKIAAKAPRRPSDSTTAEPAWLTLVKERQRCTQTYGTVKEPITKKGPGAKAETKEPRDGGAAPEKEKKQPILVSSVRTQEKMPQMNLPKSTKAAEAKKMVPMPAVDKEARRPASFPAVPADTAESVEPVWFSMAKQKAKAWSHLADMM
ncbi:acrosomal protein KIAA1210 homolog isoform X2 [Echinops telfairi]|nr:acrosomal protein KIAA1210 homolog isoform X2 [Echinops telfairi]